MYFWILSLLALVITYVVFKRHNQKQFFQSLGIPQRMEPILGVFFGMQVNDMMKKIYSIDKSAKYIGFHMFGEPVIVLRDLELIKNVLVKHFDHFTDHKGFTDENSDPLFSRNLAFLNGEKWREVRNLLSPAFTSSKMRSMYMLMSRCAENFASQFLERFSKEEAVDMKDAFTRYANDVIATCAFGLEVDSLTYPDNDFYVYGKSATNFKLFTVMKVLLLRAFPKLGRILGARFLSKRDTDFFLNLIGTTIKAREERGITRPDMLQLMMDARDKNSGDLDIMEMTAQAFIFFLGGFETTSAQMCLIAHELALNHDVQKKLQAEIDTVMKETNGKPTYEAVNNMPYLDAIFSETLRLHPVAFLNRMCSKDFELPPSLPHLKPFMVKPGMEVLIPAAAIHVDPQYYENPQKFDPDRFLSKKVTAMDVTNLGFGLGPRSCIGNRFAILEVKVLFVHLLHKCSFVPCKKTCIPLKYVKTSFVPAAKGGSWLKIESRDL